MEIRQIDQDETMMMETNIKMVHVPKHFDLNGEKISEIIFQWAMSIQDIDFTNVNVYNINITFIGKFHEVEDVG
jgi:hypothetical protein